MACRVALADRDRRGRKGPVSNRWGLFQFIVRRLLLGIITLFVVSVFIFAATQALAQGYMVAAANPHRQGEIAGIRVALLDAKQYQADWDEYTAGRKPEPPKRDLKLDTLAAAIRGELPVHVHCYRADDIARWIAVLAEFGMHITAVHHATEAYKIAPLLAEQHVCAAVWPDWWGFKREAEDGIAENAAFVDAAGGCAIMHSDVPLLGGLLNIEAAKAAAAGRRAGLVIPPERAIRWITSNAAQALSLTTRIGRIAPGMNADVVLWSGDPFSIYSHADLVLIDGAVAYDRDGPSAQRATDFELGRPQREPIR